MTTITGCPECSGTDGWHFATCSMVTSNRNKEQRKIDVRCTACKGTGKYAVTQVRTLPDVESAR